MSTTTGAPKRRVVGVLGGMGPAATLDFLQKIQAHTPRPTDRPMGDQDHLHVLVDLCPQVPDRTAAAQGRGPSPVPVLRSMAKGLVAQGADFLVVPCNSAHLFVEEAFSNIPVPLLHLVEQTCRAVKDHPDAPNAAGILATAGTIQGKLYHQHLENLGLQPIVPSPEQQKGVNQVIAQVKAQQHGPGETQALQAICQDLKTQGAQCIIAACTEIPLAISPNDLPMALLDSTDILAQATVKHACAA